MASSQGAIDVSVPLGQEPLLDGTISTEEWDDARAIELNDRSTLYLKHANDMLYIAVRATTMGIPSPLILREGDVHVLHASAALGSAVYHETDGVWGQAKDFEWHCRLRGFSEMAVAERAAFFAQEGWLGTIGYLGARTEFEYKIRLDGSSLRMLFLFMEATRPAQVLSWPAEPEEADHYLPLITGPIPLEISVDFGQWAVLTLTTD